MLSVPGALMRRFALDWLGRVDPSVPPQIMAADYTVAIGGIELRGLDSYVPATVEQYSRYLGLLLTVHDAFAAPGRIALRFTLHGAEPERPPVAWTGIALFAHDGHVLTRCRVEEDYAARRRQRKSGMCDPIEPPMPAPWALIEEPADPAAEAAVREILEKDGVKVMEMFSAGARVAFAAATMVGIFRMTDDGPQGHVVTAA
jgi:hypothetical protein